METVTRYNGVIDLAEGQIERVEVVETLSTRYPKSDYSERPLRYMVKLVGESRPRRVYATPIGNVSCVYLKSHGQNIYCETELDRALHV